VSLNIFRIHHKLDKENRLHFRLKRILGFRPIRLEFYKTAFIPRSSSLVFKDGTIINNERLEYLGDAVFDAIIADYLYKKFPGKKEGFLTTMRSKIVNGNTLGQLAQEIGLDEFIKMPPKKNNTSKTVFGDSFEAFIGAIYCDRGYNFTKKFVYKKILNKLIDIEELIIKEINYKSKIIEWGQKNKKEVLFDTSPKNEEMDANPKFITVLKIDEQEISRGFGGSKKVAEQNASEVALKKLLHSF